MINVDKHVYSLAKRYSRLLKAYGGDYDDVLQEARIAAAALPTDISEKEHYLRLRHVLLRNCAKYYGIRRQSIKTITATDYAALSVDPDDMRSFNDLVCCVANLDDQLDAETYLKRLPEKERDVIRRQYSHGQTVAEIADDLGTTCYSVAYVHKIAIKRLQGVLDEFLEANRAAHRRNAARAKGEEIPDGRRKPKESRLIDRIKGGDLTVLTDDERSCVLLSRDGLTNAEVAARLDIKVKSVEHKLKVAYFKLSGQYSCLKARNRARYAKNRMRTN